MKSKIIALLAGLAAIASSCNNGTEAVGNSRDTIANLAKAVHPRDANNPCYQPVRCSETACQDLIVTDHSISRDTFNAITNRAGNAGVDGYEKPDLQQFRDDVNNCHCNENKVIFHANTDSGPNNDINVSIDPGYKEINGKWSVALFRGVFRTYEPERIKFYKAIAFDPVENKMVNTLAFEVIKGGTVVYIGDLVGLYP